MRSFSILLNQIHKGLRESKRNPINNPTLVESKGCVPREGVLSALDAFIQLDTSSLGAQVYPFPQFFALRNISIVCTKTAIYEIIGGTLTSMISGLTSGTTWELADFYEFLYLSNGVVTVKRDAGSKAYSLITSYPTGTAICNYKGQVLVGAPDCTVGASEVFKF